MYLMQGSSYDNCATCKTGFYLSGSPGVCSACQVSIGGTNGLDCTSCNTNGANKCDSTGCPTGTVYDSSNQNCAG